MYKRGVAYVVEREVLVVFRILCIARSGKVKCSMSTPLERKVYFMNTTRQRMVEALQIVCMDVLEKAASC